MIDLKKAKKQFQLYLKDFDTKNSKNALKIRHTMGVVRMSEYISRELGLSEEDINLSMLIALLHDIGRFEQVTKYDNFVDYQTEDHAKLADKILFDEKLIEKFIDTRKYDDIILKAILNHNKLKIEDGLNKNQLFHAQLIRDADKTDNFRVKAEENYEDILNSTLEGLEQSKITEIIYDDFLASNIITSTDRVTPMDFWISYIAFIFDFNFLPGLRYIKEKNYINKIIDRINYKVPDTKEKMENIRRHAIKFVNEKLKNG